MLRITPLALLSVALITLGGATQPAVRVATHAIPFVSPQPDPATGPSIADALPYRPPAMPPTRSRVPVRVVAAADQTTVRPGGATAANSAPAPRATTVALHAAAAPAGQPGAKFVLGYYLGWAGSGSAQSMQAHAADLSAIAGLWYSIHSDGRIYLRGSSNPAKVAAVAHRLGLRALALVTNAGQDVSLQSPALLRSSAQALVTKVLAAHLDGVNIDFEGINGRDAAQLAAFVADVAAGLRPHGLLTTVAVGPRTTGSLPRSDPSDAYDYAALGRAADYVVLMTYDQHGPGTAPGPISALPWVRRVAQYALQTIPARKILLGIAGYGYDWGRGGAPTVTASQAEALGVTSGVAIGWNAASEEPFLQGAGHDVWFADGASAAFDFALATKDGLGGVALWYLGAEDTAFWHNLHNSWPPLR